MLKVQPPELSVTQTGHVITVRIFADTNRTVQIVQDLTNHDATPNWEEQKYDGLLCDLAWTKPRLDGKRRTFTATAQTAKNRINLEIGSMSVGYWGGTGPEAAAAALAQLGIADLDFLVRLLCKPQPEYLNGRHDKRDSWKRLFVPSDFGEKYSS